MMLMISDITKMNLSELNLNLLVGLNALLLEKNVTEAGKRIGVSQSAMSNVLKQLRDLYQDELLIRSQSSYMTLTECAETLREPVQLALQQIEIAFSKNRDFNPLIATRTFHIGMSDYLSYVLLPKLVEYITRYAPNIRLVIHHVNYLSSLEQFSYPALDLIIGKFPKAPSSLMSQRLFDDEGVFVVCHKHLLAQKKKISLATLAQYQYIMVSFREDPKDTFLEHFFREYDIAIKTSIVVPHAMMALHALPNTQLVTHTVRGLVKPLAKPFNLKILSTEISSPQYTAFQYWQTKYNNEPGHRWLRTTIKSLF